MAHHFFNPAACATLAPFLISLAMYLVLAAQFESFVDPFIIMLTVPLSMTGALLALKLGGGTMNIYSQVRLDFGKARAFLEY